MIHGAFDAGITHFDLANNYGPPYGSAEINVGKIFKELPRDEILITSVKQGMICGRVLMVNGDRENI